MPNYGYEVGYASDTCVVESPYCGWLFSMVSPVAKLHERVFMGSLVRVIPHQGMVGHKCLDASVSFAEMLQSVSRFLLGASPAQTCTIYSLKNMQNK